MRNFLVVAVAAVGGCVGVAPVAVPGYGQVTVASYRPGESPEVKQTPGFGTYGLYRGQAPAKDGMLPAETAPPERTETPELFGLCRIPVKEPVGFTRDPDGRLCAVAGEEKFLLPDGAPYFWQGKPEANSIGPPERPRPVVERVVEGAADVLLIGAVGAFALAVLAAYLLAAGHTM
jgi:hypothetical protein